MTGRIVSQAERNAAQAGMTAQEAKGDIELQRGLAPRDGLSYCRMAKGEICPREEAAKQPAEAPARLGAVNLLSKDTVQFEAVASRPPLKTCLAGGGE